MSEMPREEIQSDDDCGAWGDDTPSKKCNVCSIPMGHGQVEIWA